MKTHFTATANDSNN